MAKKQTTFQNPKKRNKITSHTRKKKNKAKLSIQEHWLPGWWLRKEPGQSWKRGKA